MTEDVPSIVEQAKQGGFNAAFYDFRKAKTPGLDYFNPALLRRTDGLWLVTRRSEFLASFQFGQNDLMTFHLDDDHLPLYGKSILVPRFSDREHFEDPRAFYHAGGLWLSACNFVVFPDRVSWTGAHQILLEINEYWQTERRHDPPYGKNGTSVFEQRGDEKNWLWFSHEEELHLIYLTLPHTVVRWDTSLRPVQEFVTDHWHPAWKWGEPRGGTAPIRVGDEFISFFHSSTPWRPPKRRYHMGAYAFAASPPYQVTAVTPRPLLSGSLDDPWGEGKPLVVFPCAALREKGNWTVSLGVNDLVSARVTISEKLLNSRLSREVKKITPEKPRLSSTELIYG
jgi:predicted GH43/DUF377 family glycosyl hydrolase